MYCHSIGKLALIIILCHPMPVFTEHGCNVDLQIPPLWTIINQTQSEYKHSLTFCVRHYVVVATKPMHQLQICPIVHN